MAEATRSQMALQELEKSLVKRITEATEELNQKYVESQNQFQTVTSAILEIQKNLQGRQRDEDNNQLGFHNSTQRYATHLSKVEFPAFDGSDLKDWLYRCEQFFALDNTTPEAKVRLASMHLHGSALQWHLNYMKSKCQILPDWPQYITDISLRFGELFVDPLAELISVKQTGSVQQYITAFELALTQVSLPNEHVLSIFLAGLERQTQMNVRMFNPTSMSYAANLARLYEAAHSHQSATAVGVKQYNQRSNTYSFVPLQISSSHTLNYAPKVNAKVNTDRRTRSYTSAEMADRRARGLCMFCDEPFTPRHHLKHRKAQLLVIEGEEEVEKDGILYSVVETNAQETLIMKSSVAGLPLPFFSFLDSFLSPLF